MEYITLNRSQEINFTKFKEGNEKGFEFFYKLLYPSIYYFSFRYIKDDVNASCIVNEAFLRLWLCREKITCQEHIETFLRKLSSDGCRAYFKTSSNRFHRNMLRLDEIENYQDFIAGYDPTLEFYIFYILGFCNCLKKEDKLNPVQDKKIFKRLLAEWKTVLDGYRTEIYADAMVILNIKLDTANSPTNRDKLTKTFALYGITLTAQEIKTINQRNT